MRTVLVVDDNPAVSAALELLFGLHEIRTLAAATPDEALALLSRRPVDLVIADMNFRADTTSGEEGMELFQAVRELQPDLPVILLTAWTHLEMAVELIRAGAADYVAKPWDDAKLLATVENLLELSEASRLRASAAADRRRRQAQLRADYDLRGLVFASPAMERAVELACRVARADVPVLITGPNGAGKERIAEVIHANSNKRDGPLVAVNCGALPTELIEAELFGAEAGAYTGAVKAREGRFETAAGGTLFLDEIGNLPLSGQVKLLRVLESGQFERLGSSRARDTGARVVSATNADLSQMIAAGGFRQDLYYRLNVIEINVPPLAERGEDVLPLAEAFLGADLNLADDAREALLGYRWPGNVRELKNAIERAGLLCRQGVIRAGDLGLPAAAPAPRNLDEPDRETIEAALRATGGVVSHAAQRLGMSRQALYRRMERYDIRAPG